MIRGEALETSLTPPGKRRLVLFGCPRTDCGGSGAYMPELLALTGPCHIRTACVAQENGVGKSFPLCLGKTRLRIAPSIGLRRHRPWVALNGKRPKRGALILLTALALSACATPTVTRSCLTQAQYEQFKASEPPKVHDKLTGKADEDVRPLAGSAIELRAWGHAMLDTLKICSTN